MRGEKYGHLHICALFSAALRQSDADKLILTDPHILDCFTMFVSATHKGLSGGERSYFSELGGLYAAYMAVSKAQVRPPT